MSAPSSSKPEDQSIPPPPNRRRFAYVGTGGRARMFLDPVAARFPAEAQIVGLCDLSLVRAQYHQARLRTELGYREAVPVYGAGDFGRMLRETKPDQVVVCTIDREHDRYIVESLRAGCDVVTEKPMTIDAARCARILAAVEETGRQVRVTFNARWTPGVARVRELIAGGTIGGVRHVTMEYVLDTNHGADYFRRWHSRKSDSGGLLLHKSTHHFDLINWWIDAIPECVCAQGGLAFYGRQNAVARGDEAFTRTARYHGHDNAGDPFAYSYDNSMLQDRKYEEALYLGAAERETGYIRDRNVFREDIDIEDVMNVLVRYRNGVLLNYSLNAFSPYEGYRVAFTGDRGRIEYDVWHSAHFLGSRPAGAEGNAGTRQHLRVLPHFSPPYEVPVESLAGSHGGGDALLQEQIFSLNPPRDPLGRAAGAEQGAASVLIGSAANQSMATGLAVSIARLCPLRPDARRFSELK